MKCKMMILQTWNSSLPQYDLLGFYPLMSFFAIIFLFMLMTFCYLKVRVFLVIIIIYLFSLVIGVMALSESVIPFTPFLQLFFLIFQSAILIIVSIEVFEK